MERGYHWLVRKVRVIRGNMPFRLECRPAFNYGLEAHRVELDCHGAILRSPHLNLALVSEIPLDDDAQTLWTKFTLSQGETATFILRELAAHETDCGLPVKTEEANQPFKATIAFCLF